MDLNKKVEIKKINEKRIIYAWAYVCESGGKTVLSAQWGSAISKNPFLSFKFSGAKSGDSIKVSWVDNKGNSDSIDSKIK